MSSFEISHVLGFQHCQPVAMPEMRLPVVIFTKLGTVKEGSGTVVCLLTDQRHHFIDCHPDVFQAKVKLPLGGAGPLVQHVQGVAGLVLVCRPHTRHAPMSP